jgi:hypothetical protein
MGENEGRKLKTLQKKKTPIGGLIFKIRIDHCRFC